MTSSPKLGPTSRLGVLKLGSTEGRAREEERFTAEQIAGTPHAATAGADVAARIAVPDAASRRVSIVPLSTCPEPSFGVPAAVQRHLSVSLPLRGVTLLRRPLRAVACSVWPHPAPTAAATGQGTSQQRLWQRSAPSLSRSHIPARSENGVLAVYRQVLGRRDGRWPVCWSIPRTALASGEVLLHSRGIGPDRS